MVSGFTSDAEAITQITHCRRHEGGRAATAQGSKTPSKQKEPRAFRLHPGSGPFHIPFPPCFTHSLEEGTRREEPGELRARYPETASPTCSQTALPAEHLSPAGPAPAPGGGHCPPFARQPGRKRGLGAPLQNQSSPSSTKIHTVVLLE